MNKLCYFCQALITILILNYSKLYVNICCSIAESQKYWASTKKDRFYYLFQLNTLVPPWWLYATGPKRFLPLPRSLSIYSVIRLCTRRVRNSLFQLHPQRHPTAKACWNVFRRSDKIASRRSSSSIIAWFVGN